MQTPPSSGFSLSTLSIRQYIGTFMLALTVIIVGIFSLTQLPVDLLPSITYPRIGVRLTAPGISPEVAIDEITRPLEQALSTTDGVVQIYSQTREGQVNLDLYFNPGSNVEQALNDTTAAFNRNRNRLPDSLAQPLGTRIEEPRLFKFDPSQLPVYEMALTSPSLSDVALRVFADEELSRELGIVSGVASADVSEGVQEEVRVNIDLNRLQSLGISLPTVLDRLTQRNQDVSGGRILGENSEALTRAVGRFENVGEIRDLSFATGGQAIASNPQQPSSTPANPPGQVYLRDFAEVTDGTQAERVLVNLNRKKAVKISVQKQADANTVSVVDAVKQRLAVLRKSGAIPADMVITATLDESKFIRNSLADVIGSGVSGALLAAVSVFIFLGSLRQTLIIALTIPLCTLAAAIVMKLSGFSLNIFSLGGLAISVGQSSGLNRLWLLRAFNHRLEGGTQIYGNILARSIRRPAIVVIAAVILLGGSGIVMAGQIPQEILPRISTGQANVNVQFPHGTSLATNRRVMLAVDDVLLKQPETDYVFTTTGGSLFGNSVSFNPSRSSGNITLKPGTDIEAFTERVTREMNKLNLAGIRVRVSPGSVRGLTLNNSPLRGAEVDVVLQGQDAEVLRQAGRQVLAALDDRVKLSAFRPDADDRQPEVQIRPNWERANALGLTTQTIGNTIQTAITYGRLRQRRLCPHPIAAEGATSRCAGAIESGSTQTALPIGATAPICG